ncbi:hypothetical protein FPQ18DRAFT_334741 [Pyronema domesticum]|uniref:Uncharacterized protein n=1 Tax=Pyronema omphalodes (strain CBS 100304) TaxID=1076935 RepID=U4LTI5_PYROM|nr:hypothetical protein FPQ18DRAFT_334741 [Pyronema domesticum]CCX30816.1 Protein of unknown function [Pyronema omphalodes CBS 100304]
MLPISLPILVPGALFTLFVWKLSAAPRNTSYHRFSMAAPETAARIRGDELYDIRQNHISLHGGTPVKPEPAISQIDVLSEVIKNRGQAGRRRGSGSARSGKGHRRSSSMPAMELGSKAT